MDTSIRILIWIIAVLHLYFLWLEMFAWTTRAPKVFRGFSADFFQQTRSLAANQGLYNGFLAAGLIWTQCIGNPVWYWNISVFFLSCVAIAGLYGAYSADKKIFFIQALPALITLGLLFLDR